MLKEKLFHDINKPTKINITDNVMTLTKTYCSYLKWPISPKIKESQFKIINNIYPTTEALKKRFKFEVDPCVFCMTEHETIEHLFFSCSVTTLFWKDVYRWLNIGINFSLFNKFHVMIYMNGLSKEISKMVNIIIIMGKYHIHKNKCKNSRPNIVCFKNEIKNYVTSLKGLSEESQSLGELYETMSKSLCFLNYGPLIRLKHFDTLKTLC